MNFYVQVFKFNELRLKINHNVLVFHTKI